tara:strand:- start:1798 stop:2475 length:678 start_codon:yes stop_codon:yes gene_type:complete
MKYNFNKYLNYIKIVLFFILLVLIILFIYSYTKSFFKNDIIYDDKIIYIENFLENYEYKKLLDNLENDNRTFKDENFRLVLPLNTYNNKYVYDTLYSDKYLNFIKRKTGNYKIIKSDFPIEYRIYPTGSYGMKWHSDTLLYDLPQYEAIYTLHNNSDSLTKWIDEDGQEHSIWTKPNSMLIVKAQGLKHMVTAVNNGTRSILKLIYTQTTTTNNNYSNEIKRFTV